MRLTFAAIVLLAVWRPRPTGDLRLAAAFGAALAGFFMLGQELGPRELIAIPMVVVASAGEASLGQR